MEYWEPKEIPWMSSGEVNRKRINSTNNMISNKGLQNSSAKWIPKNSILVALAGQGKTRGMVATNNVSITTNQSLAAIIPNDELYYEFIYQDFTNKYHQLRSISSGDETRGGLNKKIISNINIIIPKFHEQKKIGDFFLSIDNLISEMNGRLTLYEGIRKNMLQNLFPLDGEKVPNVRFTDFSGDWEQHKLNDMVTFFSGLTYSPNDVSSSEGVFVLRSSNIQNNEIVKSDNVYVYPSSVTSKNVQVDDIIVVVRNGSKKLIGKHAQIMETMNNTVIGAFMTGIRSNNSNFINSLLNTYQFKKEINKNLGSTINQITIGNFKKMIFNVPNNNTEKKTLGKLLRIIDDSIRDTQKKLSLYKELKKYYFQKLFI